MIVPAARPPIIILGMHRSGTSMISMLLQTLGVFIGHEVQEDHESTYFLDLNRTLFERVHADWDNPLPMQHFLANTDAREMTAAALSADLSSKRIRKFLGKKNYSKSNGLAGFDRAWSWKDPRTVFTLPLWLQLFPEAKLIYIVRNGVDVAASLMVREQAELQRYRERFPRRMAERSGKSKLEYASYKGSARCLTLDGGYDLWEEYLEEADRNLQNLGNPLLTFRYEDFLAEPRNYLEKLIEFCGLKEVPAETIEQAVAKVNCDRAGRYGSDPFLSAFYDRVKDSYLMTTNRYSPQ